MTPGLYRRQDGRIVEAEPATNPNLGECEIVVWVDPQDRDRLRWSWPVAFMGATRLCDTPNSDEWETWV